MLEIVRRVRRRRSWPWPWPVAGHLVGRGWSKAGPVEVPAIETGAERSVHVQQHQHLSVVRTQNPRITSYLITLLTRDNHGHHTVVHHAPAAACWPKAAQTAHQSFTNPRGNDVLYIQARAFQRATVAFSPQSQSGIWISVVGGVLAISNSLRLLHQAFEAGNVQVVKEFDGC